MKLNQATDYAFRITLYMSMLPFGTKITGAELAKTLNVPERFLLKIMRNLTKSKIMRSYRGVDGGFSLQSKPQDISILAVMEAVEGPAYLQKCLYDAESCTLGCKGVCSVRNSFQEVQNHMLAELSSIRFDQLALREKELRKVSGQ